MPQGCWSQRVQRGYAAALNSLFFEEERFLSLLPGNVVLHEDFLAGARIAAGGEHLGRDGHGSGREILHLLGAYAA